jgi:hypothetical protein
MSKFCGILLMHWNHDFIVLLGSTVTKAVEGKPPCCTILGQPTPALGAGGIGHCSISLVSISMVF